MAPGTLKRHPRGLGVAQEREQRADAPAAMARPARLRRAAALSVDGVDRANGLRGGLARGEGGFSSSMSCRLIGMAANTPSAAITANHAIIRMGSRRMVVTIRARRTRPCCRRPS